MPKKVLFNLLFSFFLCAFLFVTNAFAQTNLCAMSLEVVQDDGETKITGATATAVNTNTKRLYRSVLKAGMPYFAKLPEGDYKITVSKAGFKRSVGDFDNDCSEADNTLLIELYKGSARQIVNINTDQNMGRVESVSSGVYEVSRGGENGSPSTRQDGNIPKTVSGGVVNGKAINLVKPAYPAAARAVKASGAVNVQVTIDEQGNVISAAAVSGHPLLRAAAVEAARASTFSPTILEGKPVKVTGIIVYNFVP